MAGVAPSFSTADATKLIGGIERPVGYVKSALEAAGYPQLDVPESQYR